MPKISPPRHSAGMLRNQSSDLSTNCCGEWLDSSSCCFLKRPCIMHDHYPSETLCMLQSLPSQDMDLDSSKSHLSEKQSWKESNNRFQSRICKIASISQCYPSIQAWPNRHLFNCHLRYCPGLCKNQDKSSWQWNRAVRRGRTSIRWCKFRFFILTSNCRTKFDC